MKDTSYPAFRGDNRQLRLRLRKVGMVFVTCDDAGVMIESPTGDGDWLAELLFTSEIVKEAMKEATQQWAQQDHPRVLEALPGLWLAPSEIRDRRKCSGYALAAILTNQFALSENFIKMCHVAGLAPETTRVKLENLPPVAPIEINRMADFVRYLCEDNATMITDHIVLENLGQQLAESYEEINLLYTITQSITQVDHPENFIAIVCRELLATLPYAWIGALIADDTERMERFSRGLTVTGETDESEEVLHKLTLELLGQASSDIPLILDPGSNPDHAMFAPLGRTVLAYPISHNNKVIGLLVAGDKRGDDLTASSVDIKLIGATASHMSIFLDNAALYDDLNSMFLGMLEAMTSAIDAKDPYTCGHSQRVAHLTQILAESIGLDEQTCKRMHIAGLVHDVGKIGISEDVLMNPGKLTKAEFDEMKKHPEIGFRILKDIPNLRDILPGVLYHHEAWAGNGYPEQLRGEEIPLVARLITLADAFDAMSSSRTYRDSLSREEVFAEIKRCTGTQFDPELAPAFLGLDFSEYDQMAEAYHDREIERRVSGDRAA